MMLSSSSSILLALGSTVVSSFAPILLKKGSRPFRLSLTAAGAALYAVAVGMFVIALRGGELSALYPLIAFTYVLVTLWSAVFLGERVDATRILATVVIIIGVVLVGLS